MPHFRVKNHSVPCQHIREYPRAVAGEQEDVLYLAVKQYIPLDNLQPRPGDVTIIGAHANGFPKELYEPLWDEILLRSGMQGFRLRSIWIADVAFQGESGLLNETLLGNDPSWHDHARDLMHLINVKRDQMPRPIIGIGHSLGGNNLAYLSLMHPRLLTSLILLDPAISLADSDSNRSTIQIARMSMRRRDIWPSKEAAINAFKKSNFYTKWEPRVLERWNDYALREVPTMAYPALGKNENRVTLKTSKHQEVFTFLRPSSQGFGEPDFASGLPFLRPEAHEVFNRLSEVKPSVFYIYGSESSFSRPQNRHRVVDGTGIGTGGNGGKRAGRVKEVILDGIGHLVAMEAVDQCADMIAEFIASELKRWNSEEDEHRRTWAKKPATEKITLDDVRRAIIQKAAGSDNGVPTKSKL